MKTTKQMSFLPELDIEEDGELTQLFQELDYHLFMHHLSKLMGHEPNEDTKNLFRGVRWIADAMNILTGPDILEDIAYWKNPTGKGRLGEFYIALLTGAKWDPRKNIPGYDLFDSYKEGNKAGIARIQVKTSGPLVEFEDPKIWRPYIVSSTGKMEYDVLVIVALREDYNPCNASIFVIPVAKLVRLVKNGNKQIPISPNRYHGGYYHYSSRKNNWYDYELAPGSHELLPIKIARIAYRENFIVLSTHAD